MKMFDYQQIFHVGLLVPDVDRAMTELGDQLGLAWARVQHAPRRSVWTPERGPEEVGLTFVYSCEGPQHIELLRGDPGSIWDSDKTRGLHHVGVWSNDVAADAERFVSAGWSVVAAATAPEDGFGSFAYVAPPSGLIVELVSAAARPRFDTWFAGGTLGSDRDGADGDGDGVGHR
jgi:catechol 2,3-dioxygenase-like lactoylglutathione lyase family enzyme